MTVTSSTNPVFDPALNMGRQSLYRFCALALSDPRVGSWERVHEKSFQLLLGNAMRGWDWPDDY